MNTEAIAEGGCLCGDVRWRARGKSLYDYHCHCRMCQRISGAAFITGSTYQFDAVERIGATPSYYDSSENAKRVFCSRCGGTVAWQWLEEKISLFAGSFDHPENIKARWHVFTESQLPCIKLGDGVPRYKRYPEDIDNQDQGIQCNKRVRLNRVVNRHRCYTVPHLRAADLDAYAAVLVTIHDSVSGTNSIR